MADKLYYTIGEVSRMFQVNASLIRFWEKEFTIIHPQKNNKGNRVFTAKDLVKEKGFTIQGARDHLLKHKSDAEANIEVIKSLQEIRSFLIEVGKELPS